MTTNLSESPEVERLDDAAAGHRCADACLVEEHVDERTIPGEMREDPFDRDELLEAAFASDPGGENLRHAARPDAEESLLSQCLRAGKTESTQAGTERQHPAAADETNHAFVLLDGWPALVRPAAQACT